MPRREKTISVGILVHDKVALGLTLLIKDILEAANTILGTKKYHSEFISYKKRVIKLDNLQLLTLKSKTTYDYVVVSPFRALAEDDFYGYEKEIELLRSLSAQRVTLASSCLGALLLASAGLLDGKEATAHWASEGTAKKLFPKVKWNMQKMLCETSAVVTSGGYLALVDLTLNIVAKTSGKKVSQELGKYLLADSIREKQSVYATQLIADHDDTDQFKTLEKWIDQNIQKNITIKQMADRCGMSLRNFQRQVISFYGYPPKRLLQLKRIQKARALLNNSKMSIENIVFEVGISDVSAFRKIFQRELGLTLAEYRRKIV